MTSTLSAIRAELEVIEKWDREFIEFTNVDDVGRRSRQNLREELLNHLLLADLEELTRNL